MYNTSSDQIGAYNSNIHRSALNIQIIWIFRQCHTIIFSKESSISNVVYFTFTKKIQSITKLRCYNDNIIISNEPCILIISDE